MADHAAAPAEPVLTRTAIVHAIAILTSLLVLVGAGNVSTWLGDHADLIATGILFVSPFVSAYLARRKVTPLAAPKTDDGTPLVPAGSQAATLDAAVALAEADAIHPADDAEAPVDAV